MSREIINLLPSDRLRAFRRAYFLRLATTAVCLLALVVIIHGILLLPSYLNVAAAESAAEQSLASMPDPEKQTAAESSARLGTLTTDAAVVGKLGAGSTASAAVRAVLAVPRAGISITSLSYTPPSGNPESGVMTITGEAATRDALRAYDLALAALPFVTSADLPIGAYAKESDIDFTITLRGSLAP